MVHENDAKARSLEYLWRQRPRYKREEVVKRAQKAEDALLLQLKETEESIKDAVDVSANMPRLRQNVQEAKNKLALVEEVLEEAIKVMVESAVQKAYLREAFEQSREAWKQVPTYKRHQIWDTKLKKKVLKVLA